MCLLVLKFYISSGVYTRTGINAVSQSRAEGRLFTDLQWPESRETVSIYIYYSCVNLFNHMLGCCVKGEIID